MRFYIINLARAPERWEHMMRVSAHHGLSGVRIDGVDGAGLSVADVDRFAPLTADRRRLSVNEVACFESHKLAWQQIADSDDAFGCVLEDDVFLAPSFLGTCQRIVEALPHADLVKLNNYVKPIDVVKRPVAVIGSIRLHRLAQRTIDASAYLMSRTAARKALAVFETYTRELDIELFDPDGGFLVLQAVPAISVQEKFATFQFLPAAGAPSAIEESRYAEIITRKLVRPRKSIWQKIVAEYGRFRRRRIEPKLFWWTNRKRPPELCITRMSVDFANI